MSDQKKAFLIFPNQLFKSLVDKKGEYEYFLIEEPLFFNQFSFHKQKLVFLRAAFKSFEKTLRNKGLEVTYLEQSAFVNWQTFFRQHKHKEYTYVFTDDYLLEKRLNSAAQELGINLHRQESPLFISPLELTINDLSNTAKPLMASFYTTQRKRYGILMDRNNKPVGGKWSFDDENRKKVPKNWTLPKAFNTNNAKEVEEAKVYVAKYYSNNPGSTDGFYYPINHVQAERWFDQFLEERFQHFGDFEDAMVSNHRHLYHSLLSPLLNVGLLNPVEVIEKLLDYASRENIALNNTEGIIRQILGWREFMRGVYHVHGTKQRNSNYFEQNKGLNANYYQATTGIVPLDNMIRSVLHTAYNHHIERLMIAGNWMLLSQVHPHAVYQWFMELYIDAWDWVMVPNVYGMSQYADGGLITTKPYVSGSNYIHKMSDYKKGAWSSDWDALYWSFIYRNINRFKTNQRMSMICRLSEKHSAEKKEENTKRAEHIIDGLPDYIEDPKVSESH
jgi:deoxyribodipyrimidine photolyase-related protein